MPIISLDKKAPKFKLNNAYGKKIKLENYEGHWVVLFFYPKDNTTGCTQEAKNFSAASSQFKDLGATLMGISPDSEKSHKKFIEDHGLEVELLSDPEKKVLERYGVWGIKKMYGREFMGVIRTTYLIDPNRRVRQVWEKVRIKKHVEKVLEALKSVQ